MNTSGVVEARTGRHQAAIKILTVFAVIAAPALTGVVTLTGLTDRAVLTGLVQTVVDFSGAVNAPEACFAYAVRRS